MSKLGDRIFQKVLRTFSPILPWREPEILKAYDELVDVLIKQNKSRIFIVMDEGLVQLKLHQPLLDALKNKQLNYRVFSDITANPTTAQVEEGLLAYIIYGGDAIIGFGGGSPMDVAKAIAARVARPRKNLKQLGGLLKVRKKTPLLIAVPTTSGTGSEATVASIVVDERTKHKYAINDPVLIPSYALLVPTLTFKLPKFVTAMTGMDALTHAIEAYTNKGGRKFPNEKAINATRLVFENLKVAYDNPSDLEARKNMQLAAYDAGVAFTRNYVGYVHALSHPLSAYYGLAHGYVNALILPFMLEKYGRRIYRKLARLARLSGVVEEGLSNGETAKLFIAKIRALNTYFEIPTTIPEIKEEDIPQLAVYANKEARPLYPTPRIYKTSELEEFYRELKGEILNVETN